MFPVQHRLFGGIPLNDGGVVETVCQVLTAVSPLLDNLHADAVVLQPFCQVVGNPSAAGDGDVPDALGDDVQVVQQCGEVAGGSGDVHVISLLQNKFTGRNDDLVPASHNAYQNLAFHDIRNLIQRLVANRAAGGNVQFHQVYQSVDEFFPAQESRVPKETADFVSGLEFRIDGKGQAQLFLQHIRTFHVFRRANPGDGCDVRIQSFCGKTGEQIGFIFTGGRNQQIRLLDVGGAKNAHRCAVALDGHHIILLQSRFQSGRILIDYHQIVPVSRELIRQKVSHLTGTGNNNLHIYISS